MDINLTIIGQTIAMIVFVWFCMKYIWPPLMTAIEERRKNIADGIAAGEQGQRALEAAEASASEVIGEARSKALQIVEEANARYNEILQEAKADAQKERERQAAMAQAELEQDINRARDELRGQVNAIALAGAEKILMREIDANAHKELLDQLAANL